MSIPVRFERFLLLPVSLNLNPPRGYLVKYEVKYKVLEGKTKIIIPGKRGKTGVIYIPADLIKDSSFPFKPKEELQIRIIGEKLVVEKWKPD